MKLSFHSTDVHCGLGVSLDDALDNLRAQRILSQPLILELKGDTFNRHYFRLAGRSDLGAYHEVCALIELQLNRLLDVAGLSSADRRRVGLFVGSSSFSAGYSEESYRQQAQAGHENRIVLQQIGYDIMTEQLVRRLGLSDTSFCYATACTSSANAILNAQEFIRQGVISHALILGYELFNTTSVLGFYGLDLISKQGAMLPFDVRRDGLLLGEGYASMLLSAEPLSGAVSLLGGASNTDNHSLTAANTDGSSVAAVMEMAMTACGIDADSVRGIKTHGTASLFNDEAETAGILRLPLSSPQLFALKPYTGHTLGACGAIETALTAGALGQGWVPANSGFSTDDTLGVSLNQTVEHTDSGHYLLNFFAFGGNNTCLILECA